MKTKEFNRSNAKELSNKIQDALSELGKEYGVSITTGNGKFDAKKFVVQLNCRILSETGEVEAAEYLHSLANGNMKSSGATVIGNVIGSVWSIKDSIYTVMDYVPKRPKYPFSLQRSDGRMSKCPTGFIKQGIQLVKPTESEFKIWFTVDPDSDAVKNSDVEICDRVNDYLGVTLPVGEGDTFFELVDAMNEKFSGKKLLAYAKDVFTTLYGNSSTGLKDANLYMKSLTKKGK